jgi:aminoglycoside phosphotransferase (APT) family kinase protein
MSYDAPFPSPSPEALRAIADRHGLSGEIVRMDTVGMVNAVWSIGDGAILRIPKDEPVSLAETLAESVVAPIARDAGVLTPRLLAWDPACDLVSVPYTVWERAPGRTFASVVADPADHPLWSDVGAAIASLHDVNPEVSDPHGWVPEESGLDPWDLLARARGGCDLRAFQVDWVARWLDRLRPAFDGPRERRLLHDDLHPFNLLVDGPPGAEALTAILDWGDAGFGDSALEFVAIPSRAVPRALRGYRSVRPLDDLAVGRIVAWQLAIALDLVLGAPRIPPVIRWVELLRVDWADPSMRPWAPPA